MQTYCSPNGIFDRNLQGVLPSDFWSNVCQVSRYLWTLTHHAGSLRCQRRRVSTAREESNVSIITLSVLANGSDVYVK